MGGEILVDTSVWVQFFNCVESPQAEYLRQSVQDDQPLCLCPIIIGRDSFLCPIWVYGKQRADRGLCRLGSLRGFMPAREHEQVYKPSGSAHLPVSCMV